jgi:hypothetical protein
MNAEPATNTKEEDMLTPKVTEIARLSPHHRQVLLVRASLLRGVSHSSGSGASKR